MRDGSKLIEMGSNNARQDGSKLFYGIKLFEMTATVFETVSSNCAVLQNQTKPPMAAYMGIFWVNKLILIM